MVGINAFPRCSDDSAPSSKSTWTNRGKIGEGGLGKSDFSPSLVVALWLRARFQCVNHPWTFVVGSETTATSAIPSAWETSGSRAATADKGVLIRCHRHVASPWSYSTTSIVLWGNAMCGVLSTASAHYIYAFMGARNCYDHHFGGFYIRTASWSPSSASCFDMRTPCPERAGRQIELLARQPNYKPQSDWITGVLYLGWCASWRSRRSGHMIHVAPCHWHGIMPCIIVSKAKVFYPLHCNTLWCTTLFEFILTKSVYSDSYWEVELKDVTVYQTSQKVVCN